MSAPDATGGPEFERLQRRNAKVLYIAFIISGAAGLMYEVVWASLLGQLIGGTTATHTVVLAAFMGGLALGNRYGGRWADGELTPLRLYGYLEAAVGVLGILSPKLADLAGATYVALAPAPDSGLVFLDLPLRLLLAVLTILPGAFAMGGTLPALVRATTSHLGGLGSSVGWLYFINSVGATAGAFAAGFLLIPVYGLDLTLIIAGCLNLMLAVVSLTLAAERPKAGAASTTPTPAPTPTASEAPPAAAVHLIEEGRQYPLSQSRAALHAVFLSGIATMMIEVVWTRVLGLTMGGSAHAFSIMLCTFIGGISIGGVIAARLARDDRDAYRPLLIAEAIAAGSLLLLMPWYDHLPFLFHDFARQLARDEAAYPLYLAISTSTAVIAMALPTLAMGATLPLASRVATSALAEAGRKVGGTFSINTLGNVIGASVGGLVLVPLLGLEATFRIGTAFLFLAVLRLLLPAGLPAMARRVAISALSVGALLLVFSPGWNAFILHAGLYRTLDHDYGSVDEFKATTTGIDFLYAEDDAEATVSVVENALGHRLLRINGKSDASNHGDVPTQVLVGQVPFLFHPAPKRVLVVGLGSGITVGTFLSHPSVERVDVVEISPAVARASRYFDEWSGAPLDDPRVHLYVRDARSYMRTVPADMRWDVIISEPSNPWQPGSAMLFTEEYYEQLKGRLAPGGVMSQWVHTYEMSDAVLETILSTYSAVFPEPRIFNSKGNDMVLVAAPDGLQVDLERMEALIARPEVARELARITPDDVPPDMLTLLSHEVMGPARFKKRFVGGESGSLHTDRFPVLQYQAPRAFFVGESAKLFKHLDGRRSPRPGSDLLLARWLGDRLLTQAELEHLAGYFQARDRMLDKPVALAIARELWERAPDDAKTMRRLQQLEGLDIVAEERLWQATLAQGKPAEQRSCLRWADYEFRRMAGAVSIYTRPRFDRYDAAVRWCLEKYPGLKQRFAQYRRRLAPHRGKRPPVKSAPPRP